MNLKKLVVTMGLDAQDYLKGLVDAKEATETHTSGIVDNLRKIGGATVLGALAAGTAAIGMLGAGLGIAIHEAMGAQEVMAQTRAVIESTGGAAGMTAEQIADLSTELSLSSRFADDAIQEGANLLLTFKNIGEDTFPTATQAMVDMATAMGTDVKAGAIQLGKALNDPVMGISALSRVGIQFTEDQQELIKSLVEAGDVAGAQTIILAELESQFGGSAAAAAETFGGKLDVLKNRLLNVAEGIGGPLLTVGASLIDTFLTPVIPIIEKVGSVLSVVMEDLALGDVGLAFDDLREGLFGIGQALGIPAESIQAFNGFITELFPIVKGLIDVFILGEEPLGDWSVLWEHLAGFVGPQLAQTITDLIFQLSQLIPWLTEQIPLAFAWLQENEGVIIGILAALGVAVAAFVFGTVVPAALAAIGALAPIVLPLIAIAATVALLYEAWQNNWGGIRDTLTAFWTDTGAPLLAELQAWLQTNIPIAISTLQSFWQTVLLPAIQDVWAWITGTLIPMLGDLWTWLQVTVPAAIATLQDYWQNTLLPAIQLVWGFVQDDLMPLFKALVDFFDAAFTLALTALAGLWQNVLEPALAAVREEVGERLQPIFEALEEFWTNTFGPKLTSVKESVLDKLPGVFQSIRDAIGWVVEKIGILTDKLNSVQLPWWLTPGSPTPWELGLRGVGDAMEELSRRELPRLAATLQLAPAFAGVPAGVGVGGAATQQRIIQLTAHYPTLESEPDVAHTLRLIERLES